MKSYLLLFSAGHKFLFDQLFKVPDFMNIIYDCIIIVKTHIYPKPFHCTLSFCNHRQYVTYVLLICQDSEPLEEF